jgi:hypothetical protein
MKSWENCLNQAVSDPNQASQAGFSGNKTLPKKTKWVALTKEDLSQVSGHNKLTVHHYKSCSFGRWSPQECTHTASPGHALHLPWKHLQKVWNPAKYNHLLEYKYKSFCKIRWIIWAETRLSIIIYLQQPSWCQVCHRVVLEYGIPHGIHTQRTPVATEHTSSRYQNYKLM